MYNEIRVLMYINKTRNFNPSASNKKQLKAIHFIQYNFKSDYKPKCLTF